MGRYKHLLFPIKLTVGIGLLIALLLIDDNWLNVVDLARNIRGAFLIPFIAVSGLLVWISCLKWSLFLRERGSYLSIFRLMKFYLIGFFFNNFFPTNFGGDVVRSYITGREIDSQEQALATIFLERFTGFLAMVSLAMGAFLLSSSLRNETLVRWSILIMGGGTVGVLIFILKPWILTWTLSPFRGLEIVHSLKAKALRFHNHITHFRGKPWVLVRAMLYSYVFYVFAAANVYAAGLLLDIHCNVLQLLAVTPIVMLLASFPLTPNSVGVWEWGFSVYLVSAGATSEQGLTIALALRAKDILVSLMGGGLFILEPKAHGDQKMSAVALKQAYQQYPNGTIENELTNSEHER